MGKYISFGIVTMLFWSLLSTNSFGQEDPLRVFMYLNYFQSTDHEYLEAELKYRDAERQFQQLADTEVELYLLNDDSDVLLGKNKTNESGIARFDLTDIDYDRDSLGRAAFEAIFSGNDNYRKASRDIETIRATLSLDLAMVDSVKTVKVLGKELGTDNPINDVDIQLLVKRTYSNLPIAEGGLQNGSWQTEFPDDLPGDPLGDLEIIVKIAEHDDYGTVEVREKVNWGKQVPVELITRKRALWGRPPIWIMVAASLAFFAAWVHYFMAMFNLIKIRRHSVN